MAGEGGKRGAEQMRFLKNRQREKWLL